MATDLARCVALLTPNLAPTRHPPTLTQVVHTDPESGNVNEVFFKMKGLTKMYKIMNAFWCTPTTRSRTRTLTPAPEPAPSPLTLALTPSPLGGSQRQGVDRAAVEFSFDGRVIQATLALTLTLTLHPSPPHPRPLTLAPSPSQDNDTPSGLDMEDGDIIDVAALGGPE